MIKPEALDAGLKLLGETTKRVLGIYKRVKDGAGLSVTDQSYARDVLPAAGGALELMRQAVSANVLAEIFGVSSRTVGTYRSQGMPALPSGYSIPAAVQWRISRCTGIDAEEVRERKKLLVAQRRRTTAQAKSAELELQRSEGELINRAEVENLEVAKVEIVRRALGGLPRDLLGLVGRTPEEQSAWLEERLGEICNRFADDVNTPWEPPPPEDETGNKPKL